MSIWPLAPGSVPTHRRGICFLCFSMFEESVTHKYKPDTFISGISLFDACILEPCSNLKLDVCQCYVWCLLISGFVHIKHVILYLLTIHTHANQSQPELGLYWCRASSCFINSLKWFTVQAIFTHSHTHSCSVYTAVSREFEVQYLAQGHFGMQTGGAGDRTTNILVSGRLPLLPEPQPL